MKGPKGGEGWRGFQGVKGKQGYKGDKGKVGMTGARGKQGLKGKLSLVFKFGKKSVTFCRQNNLLYRAFSPKKYVKLFS